MKIKTISAFLIFLAATAPVMAHQDKASMSLAMAREQTIKQYIVDLKTADYEGISGLFDENGIVISTSKGKVNARDFFYSFLPEIESANTELHQLFVNNTESNRYAARFHFNFKLKDSEVGEGEYVDEFVFANNSSKLLAVYMFENLKFENNAGPDF